MSEDAADYLEEGKGEDPDQEFESTADALDDPDEFISSQPLRKRRKLMKRAPNAPKRFKSAYICFISEKMEEMKRQADTKV
jgi:hypothetical protein